MTIKVGDRIPNATLNYLKDGVQAISTDEIFKGKKVVLFSVPGAFTPTCSAKHLPGYVERFAQFKAKGVDVACLAVNDAFVMAAWAKDQHVPDGLLMLALSPRRSGWKWTERHSASACAASALRCTPTTASSSS